MKVKMNTSCMIRLYEISRLVKIQETESRRGDARSWGRGAEIESCSMGTVVVLQDNKVLEICYMTT